VTEGPVNVLDPGMPAPTSILATPQGACALVSVLIMRLGGRVVITADEFLAIQGTIFFESALQEHTGAPNNERLLVEVQSGRAPDGGHLQ
jgi:hypothetical protein